MVLDPNCVRDILIAVEDSSIGERLNLDTLHAKIPEHDAETVWYACLKLNEGGYIDLTSVQLLRVPMPSIKSINSLTYDGHELLNSIRSESNWSKTKDVAKKAGVFSLKGIAEIGQQVASAAITAALQSLQ